jgi:hypothetical protein
VNIRHPIAAALAHAVLLGTVTLPPILAPVPAIAQTAQAQRTVAGVRLLGEWQINGHRLHITEAGMGRIRFRATKADSGEEVSRGELAPYENRWAMKGDVTIGPAHAPKGKTPLALFVTPDGKFEGWNLDDALDVPFHRRDRMLRQEPTSGTTLSAEEVARWSGDWRTSRGLMTLAAERNHLAGLITHGTGTRQFEAVALIPGGGVAVGAWGTNYDKNTNEQSGIVHWGDATLQISADGKSFTGWYTDVSGGQAQRIEWSGRRYFDETSSRPSQQDPTAKTLLGRWTTPFGVIEFTDRAIKGVEHVGAEMTDAAGMRHYLNYTPGSGGLIHLMSGSSSQNYPRPIVLAGDGGSFDVMGDRQGVGGVWRAVRVQSQPPSRTPRPRSEAEAPVLPNAPAPAPRPAQPAPEAQQAAGFQPLEKWDVRVDRVENPRDDRLTHVYLTLRNSGTGTLVQTQGVSVRHEDGDGVVTESGQGVRAKPGYPELFGSPPPVVLPGREIKTKFVFDRNGGTARITVVEGKAVADFDF